MKGRILLTDADLTPEPVDPLLEYLYREDLAQLQRRSVFANHVQRILLTDDPTPPYAAGARVGDTITVRLPERWRRLQSRDPSPDTEQAP